MYKSFSFLRVTAFSLFANLPLGISAGPVSETAALQKAQAFLKERNPFDVPTLQSATLRTTSHTRRVKSSVSDESSLYVFNVGTNDGFVIVSGDDRTPAILGYADSGAIAEGDIPDGLQYLLDGYVEQIDWMDAQGYYDDYATCGSRRTQAVARTAIAPLIQTRWNQGEPYNNLCPEIDDEKAVTGCVATSLAQLMYYHKWPQGAATAIPGYTTTTKDKKKESINLTVPPLAATTFSWNTMTNTYADDATGAAADAVATLMQYCGSALQMMYGLSANDGSSAYTENIPYALKAYFGYDGGVRHAYRSTYSYAEWVNLIYGELAEGRPVALGGQSTGGGHSFVCDGYQGDDYFHINWGWGGSSDGYFRLSALNPREQGFGGSSSLDGFSFYQDAVIGIQKPVDGNKDYCLSLEGLHLVSNTNTFTRANTDENFTGISIYFLVYSYYQGTNAFDFAVQLVDGSGNVIQTFYEALKQSLDWNGNKGGTISGIIIPNTVANGTYYIKVMSRPNGTSDWQECFDGDRYQMTAVISENELTFTVPIPATAVPSTATIDIEGSGTEGYLTQGYEQEITASFTGGPADYHGNVILCVDGYPVMGKMLDIPAGQTVDAHYVYTPTTAGEKTLAFYTKFARDTNQQLIGSGTHIGNYNKTVTISTSNVTNTQNISINNYTIHNLLQNDVLYGNALKVTVTLKNPSSDNRFASKFNCSLRSYNNTTDDEDDYIDAIVESKNIVIDKNGTTDVTFEYTGLKKDTYYCLRFSYTQGYVQDGVTKRRTVVFLPMTDRYPMGEGFIIYDSDGTHAIGKKDDNIDGGNAAFIDLSSISDLSGINISCSSNPNCLYLLADGVDTPSDLTAKNVVKGTVAENIALTDGNNFYSPIDFTATNISYTRTFTRAATTTGGWNTLYLPFDVSSVSASGNTIDWFHSDSDTGKDFWLKTMTGDDNGKVYFDHANSLKANTPYIIALPGSDFGDKQLTEKPITFSASDANIKATTTGSLNGNSYKFRGSTVGQTLSDVFMLNTKGDKFIKATRDTALPAFRTWIEASNISSLSRQQLVIGDGDIQGIHDMEDGKLKKDENGALYTLDGRRVNSQSTSKKGLYIRNGKKIIIK